MKNNAFRIVYDAIVWGEKKVLDEEDLEKCIDIAAKNKVLLHFLRTMNIDGDIRVRRENMYKEFLRSLRLVANALKDIDHVFIKLRKPVKYVPSDIDVLLRRRDIGKAYNRLRSLGFKAEVVEPYTLTVTRGSIIVDLYVHPTMGDIIYIDGEKLIEYRENGFFEDIEIPVLEKPVEALIVAAHAVYKERIYTLNDYMTIKMWGSSKTVRLAKDFKCLDAVREALSINDMVGRGDLILPYKIPLNKWIILFTRKIFSDNVTRGTILRTSRALRDPRFGKMVKSKLFRETY
ncbi:hypothetical protein [Staphylothermus hellenicus]|uniref:Nucleotidyltransferase family protein n=1 Tax=Staphylothermus hellenicus (strain DSM 12710 / JCM 10830 / BK20S6-10-b1 / P8) TaxID=591019 RepID=D7D858_STAHD|nr:hypothetical protein [Staphylothermus hellenicus]ADI31954.1 hypothetical protein Shell_0842 [Staphylothermus hellenicus DSM 12710]